MLRSTISPTGFTQDWRYSAGRGVLVRSGPAGLWQTGFALLALLIYSGVNFGLNPDPIAPPPESNWIYTVSQTLLLLGSFGLVLRYSRACLAALPALSPFLVLLSLALFSALWSQSSGASFHRSVSLATMLAFALYAHAVLGTLRVCRIQVAAMWLAALASLVMAVAVPASGYDVGDYAGAIRGVFTQKNGLGEAMMAGTLALSYVMLARRRVVWTDAVHAALFLAMTLLAQSTTSLLLSAIIFGVTLVTLAMSRGLAWAGVSLFVCGGLAVALILAFALSPDTFFGLAGKDMTLTGRTAIWAAINRAAGGPTLLGYGYSAFWLPTSRVTQLIWAEMYWPVPSAHSGYLDTVLELGTVGLGLIIALGLLTSLLAAWAIAAGYWAEGIWALTLLVVLGLFNVDESSLPRPDIHQLQWVLAFLALPQVLTRRGPTA